MLCPTFSVWNITKYNWSTLRIHKYKLSISESCGVLKRPRGSRRRPRVSLSNDVKRGSKDVQSDPIFNGGPKDVQWGPTYVKESPTDVQWVPKASKGIKRSPRGSERRTLEVPKSPRGSHRRTEVMKTPKRYQNKYYGGEECSSVDSFS